MTMAAKRDYYEVLGISRSASADQIKKGYRKLALQYHPDRNPGDKNAEERFKEAAEAYAILSDPEKRAQYDQFGHSLGGRGFQGFEGFEDAFRSFGDIFGDIFEDFFGGGPSGRGRTRVRRGSDLEMSVPIELKDVLKGREVELEIPRHEACGECRGSGAERGSKKTVCPDCGGQGEIRISQGFFTLRRTCPRCRGEGERVDRPCTACRGQGRVIKKRKLSVRIPPGIDHLARLRVSGEGEAGMNGGPRGDLYVEVVIKPHEIFERRGNEVLCEILVPFTVAALGGEVEVPTLEGPASLKVPASTPAGKVFKLRHKGLPVLGDAAARGDQYVRIEIEVPAHLSGAQRKLLQEFAGLRGEKAQVRKKGILDRFKESFETP